MKLATYRSDGRDRVGLVHGGDKWLFDLASVSRRVDETLMPCEFIGSGTVGNGCGLELGWYLEDGDSVELEVEKIGVLKNRSSAKPSDPTMRRP